MSTSNNDYLTLTNDEQSALSSALLKTLRSTLFANRLTISPRRINQFVTELAGDFQRYQRSEAGDALARAFGEQLSQEGLGHASLLALVETLYCFVWEHCTAQPAAGALTARYCSCVMGGYMAAREAELLREQARTHQALDRAMGKPEA